MLTRNPPAGATSHDRAGAEVQSLTRDVPRFRVTKIIDAVGDVPRIQAVSHGVGDPRCRTRLPRPLRVPVDRYRRGGIGRVRGHDIGGDYLPGTLHGSRLRQGNESGVGGRIGRPVEQGPGGTVRVEGHDPSVDHRGKVRADRVEGIRQVHRKEQVTHVGGVLGNQVEEADPRAAHPDVDRSDPLRETCGRDVH
jgi:hypothetical protein